MLDHGKTGRFIAQLRKQKGLTQKDLAERLGISDKAVSKWETGKGMPDVSAIPELCEILSISSNELLAGEYLSSAESFSQKAEENIMELMKTNKAEKSKSKWSLIGGIAGVILLTLYLVALGGLKRDYMIRFVDLPSLFCVAGISVLILVAAGRLGDFFRGIGLCFQRKEALWDISPEAQARRKAAQDAVNTAIYANVMGGLFGTLTAIMYLLTQITSPEQIGPNVAVALLTLFYGLLFAMLLLPVRERIRG